MVNSEDQCLWYLTAFCVGSNFSKYCYNPYRKKRKISHQHQYRDHREPERPGNAFDGYLTQSQIQAQVKELIELDIERDVNPVDLIEQVASINDWQYS